MSKESLINEKFGRLIVLGEIIKRDASRKRVSWDCVCDCGNTVEVRGDNLESGHTESCGCLHKEISGKRMKTSNPALIKHGEAKSRLYKTWKDMQYRCKNSNATGYKYYGGRGIQVCLEWKNDFTVFREFALANGYENDLTIDRIDNDGDYEPYNCQFITQSENTRKRFKMF